MNRDDIIRMAREVGLTDWETSAYGNQLEWFANLVAAEEREKVAQWMIQRSYATGHGDTTEDLLAELEWQIAENWNRAMINGVETEREACAQTVASIAGDEQYRWAAMAIRARGRE
jgi:hypothetical protein